MKHSIIISAVFFITLLSCNDTPANNEQKHETPQALEDKSSFEIISKRGGDDLVESLYKELSDKTPALKELELEIKNLSESKADSTRVFDKYDEKNRSYYDAANRHVEELKDSVLKDRIKILIASGVTKYNSNISRHTTLIKTIDSKILTLNDLHNILKITRTLPVIEQYQIDHLPVTNPLEGYLKQMEKTVRFADSLAKR